MDLFWCFLFYSFIGFLLEITFAKLTGGNPHRKCFLFLPLCPVYGLGAGTVAVLVPADLPPALIILIGGALTTAWEYITAAFYEDVLGVSFWDYSDMPLNLHGRICLPFSIAWGLLCIPLVRFLHPLLLALPFAPPPFVTLLAALALTADAAISSVLLLGSGTRDCLNWDKK